VKTAADLEMKLYEHTLESILEGIALLDPDGKILFVNNAFTQRFGYSKRDVIGKDIQILLSEKNPATIIGDIYERTLQDGWDGRLFIKKQDGTELPVYVATSVLKDESGEPKGLVCVSPDISRQKFLEEQFIQIKKMEGISVLVEGIAHNFNNILAIIMGYASLSLSKDITREKIDRNLEIIVEATERGAKLIKQLFTLRRPHTIDLQLLDINKLILNTIHIASETFTRIYKFTTYLNPELPNILADQSSMQQAILSILLNARDAMPEGGTTTITTEVIDDDRFLKNGLTHAMHETFIKISITDSGIGMDSETKDQIFDPFFTTKEVGKGIGLGMTIVYGTVKNHNGFIDVESTLGKGTTVCIYLPVEIQSKK
jgi:two-component system, cell cycle sensor histidine kinase and response regulator CckA